MVLWMLLALPWVVGLVLARRHHLDAGGWGVVLTVSIGLSTLWVTWAPFRDARKAGAVGRGPDLLRVADQLAAAIGRQWDNEAAVRRLNDPYPLPVSWTAAPADLAAPWKSLAELASSGVGWPPPGPGRTWAAGPVGLTGKGGELAEILAKVPTGRLVVLGEPGSGKTMLMVRLVLDLLTARPDGGPVPVLAPLASWDPSAQDLVGWLTTRLIIDYPALAGPPPAGADGPTQAAALLSAGLITPVLDGLDEIPEPARGMAISRINDALRPGEQVLLTCRTRQYRDAARPPDGLEVTLAGAAAIELRPLDARVVRRYLQDDSPGPVTRARWDSVLKLLGTQAPAGQALTTPLMVALARTIYNPRPGETLAAVPDPAELCGFTSREVVEAHLFDAFIPAAYRPAMSGRWAVGEAERWLAFLARHLEHTIGTSDLAWWQLEKAVSRATLRLAFGLMFGLVAGLVVGLVFGLGFGSGFGLVVGLLAGFVFGLAVALVSGSGLGAELPARGIRISMAGLRFGLVVGLLAGLVIGLVAGLAFGLGSGFAFGLGAGLVCGLMTVFDGVPSDVAEAIGPRIVLIRDRQVLLFFTVGIGLVTGLMLALIGTFGLVAGLAAGLAIGLVAGFATGLSETRWTSYLLARGWLAFRHQLPWPLMAFLADAHQRGVLRQAGATYQFRHLELQRQLATRP
jgi:NACHT domain-containing protein